MHIDKAKMRYREKSVLADIGFIIFELFLLDAVLRECNLFSYWTEGERHQCMKSGSIPKSNEIPQYRAVCFNRPIQGVSSGGGYIIYVCVTLAFPAVY